MHSALYLTIPLVLIAFVGIAEAQTITYNGTDPCFLNYTAGPQMFDNCYDDDYLTFATLGWDWITGGFFSMIFVAVWMFATWVKYHKMMYPILIGVMFMPISWFLFPESFLSWGIIMAFIGIGISLWYIFIKQTKEY